MALYDSGATYDSPGLFYDQGVTPDPPGDPVGWTETGGGNHGGEDWAILVDTALAGVHRNVGRFFVAAGVVVTVAGYDGSGLGELEVRAREADIAGAIVASAQGYRGGVIGGAGEGPFGGAAGVDGGYLTGAGQGDSSTDTTGVKGSGGGGGPAAPGGAGGGLIRLFATAALRVPTGGLILAHGGPEGEAAAGHGAGGGIVLHCDGPYGLDVDGDVRTLGGGTMTANGGTLKEFALASRLAVSGSTSAGRTYSDTTLRRGRVVA